MEDNGKRSFLRKVTLATLVGGLATGIGVSAWAHGDQGRGRHGGGFMSQSFDPERMDQRIERMAKHFAVELDATPEQSAKLAEIAKGAARDLRPIRETLRDARKRGMALLAAPNVDRAAIEQLRSEQIRAADAASKRLTLALADAADVLTPEQRKKAAERLERRHHWRGGASGNRG